jgi:hypothetical protein
VTFSLGNVARKGKWMKTIIAALALCALAQNALAAGPDCRAIESNSARLACHDAASPPKKIEKPKAVEKEATRPEYKDPFVAENARTTSKLNNICRGC